MKKRMLAVLLSTSLVAAALVGCGSSAPAAAPAAPKAEEKKEEAPKAEEKVEEAPAAEEAAPVEIRACWWGDTSRNEKYNAIIDLFEEANPNITVVRESGSWGDYWDKLATQVAGGSAPDFICMHVQYIADYAGRGVLADIQPFIDAGIIDTTNMDPAILDTCKYDGTMMLIPMGVTFTTALINTGLFEAAGLTTPGIEDDYKYEDLIAMGEQLQAAVGKDTYIIDDWSGSFTPFRYAARMAGGDLYTADGELGYDEAVLEQWFTYWNEMRDKGLIPDAETTTELWNCPVEQKLFVQDKVAISTAPANQLYLHQEQMEGNDVNLARLPRFENAKDRGEFAEGAHFSINAASSPEKQEAAAKLMSFWTNNEAANEIYLTDQGVPASSAVAEHIKGFVDDNAGEVIDYVQATMPIIHPATVAPKGASEIQALFEDIASRVRFGQLTPADAAKEMIASANDILAANK